MSTHRVAMSSPVYRVLQVAVASRAAVLLLALLADAAVQDYDSSARYDVPNTSTRCELSDGDEKQPQARGRRAAPACARGSRNATRHVQKEPLAQALCHVLQARQ